MFLNCFFGNCAQTQKANDAAQGSNCVRHRLEHQARVRVENHQSAHLHQTATFQTRRIHPAHILWPQVLRVRRRQALRSLERRRQSIHDNAASTRARRAVHASYQCVWVELFWITSNHTLYANGCNEHGQLGIGTRGKLVKLHRQAPPQLVRGLSNVRDAQSASTYSLALCSKNSDSTTAILSLWSRSAGTALPSELVILLLFSKPYYFF